ncbi:MAG: hypothetical protein IPG01_04180 [Chitinophagaceae bacterium]|nr:hypothetical protein [Chitinophagaceae bacterium]
MNFEPLLKLFKIFEKNKWTTHALYETVMLNFCNLLTNLNEQQRDLILELTDRYNWISPNELSAKLTNTLNLVEAEKLKSCKRIIVFPIMRPEDEDKVKSGHMIVYMVRGVKPFLKQYDHIQVIELIKYEDIKHDKFKADVSDQIFLVDDYLGSGETIKTTIELVLKNRTIELSQLNVIAIASQRDTIDFVKGQGIPIYFDHEEKRGITDYYETEGASEKIMIMLEIEKLIPGGSLFSLGYNKSEALITLTRTPDNTFPIFWKEHKKDGQGFKAPFPRY